MKKHSLLLSIIIMVMFGFRSYASAPIVTISSGLTTDTICSGQSVTFTATPGIAGSYGYIWNVGGTYVGASAPTYTTTTLVNGDVIYCLLTNAAGDTILGVSDSITIYVNTLPAISPITGIDSVCIGDSIHLSDAAPGGLWVSTNTTAATISSDGTVTGLAIPTGGGGAGGPSVRIYYILTNTCGSDSVRIRVYVRAPASPITLTSGTICLDSAITLTDAAPGGIWTSSDSTIASVALTFTGPPNPPIEKLTGHTVGTVTVTYNLTNACGVYSETTNVSVINCDTVAAVHNVVSIANDCNIYPNPSTGIFNIMARSSRYSQANCTVANIVGEKVKGLIINTNQETTIDMNIPTGVYFITISAGDEKYTTKMVIMQ